MAEFAKKEALEAAQQDANNGSTEGLSLVDSASIIIRFYKKPIVEISADNYGDVVMTDKTDAESQEILRTGGLVLLGFLIQQLELSERRDKKNIKEICN